jgi:pyruvate,water dikinase
MCDIIWFKDCSHSNKNLVGGKCCSLGELYSQSNQCGFSIADGFAITTTLYDNFIRENKLDDAIRCELDGLDIENIRLLEIASEKVKKLIIQANFSETQAAQIVKNYRELGVLYKQDDVAVAVRSSAIAEDMPNASFAGQQDTYLNIAGDVHLLESVKRCFASLYNGRAISYRKTHNIQAAEVKMSVAIQKMVRSDIGSAGVAFSMDPETGYNKAVVINSSFGLGELVVSGGVRPDEYILDKRVLKDVDADADPIVAKTLGDKNSKIIYSEDGGVKEVDTTDSEKTAFSLTNGQAVQLARFVLMLEGVYSGIYDKQIGVDVEWAVDGLDNRIYIIQTRPETIHSNSNVLEISRYRLTERSDILIKGVAVGDKISSGKIKILTSIFESDKFTPGDILVTEMTTPDWEPIMKISSGVITNKGGRTCHAAIVARELGLNAIVGTGRATDILRNTEYATISCAEGEQGIVYNGRLTFDIEKIKISNNLKLPIKLMLNVGNPENSFNSSIIPSSGVGLARLEFIISNYIKIHPLALCDYPNIKDNLRDKIREIIGDHRDGRKYFIKRLARGMAKIASAFYPHKVIVRLSDFKSNEYRNLIGGELYEPNEENPMIGWRGASRYYSPDYERGFELECAAIKYAREKMKMDNVVVMIPFCRTPHECQLVLNTMEKYGLKRGVNKLEVYLMCEIPSNVIEADKFAPMVDGVSIGGNDLLQLTLGVDRDSEKITYLSNDENLSYRRMISMAISTYKEHGVKVGFCGQQPSDSIEFCRFLIEQDIDSISVTPDSALKTIKNLGIEGN